MFPPFWGMPPTTSAMLEQIQRELGQMTERFDGTFRRLIGTHPVAVAQTPAEVVHTDNKLRVLRYQPVVERPHPVPLLIVPSLINRYYIFDLQPGKSMVEYLLSQGIDVYMIDWGEAGPEDRFVTFDHYITGYLRRIVQRVRTLSGQDRISLLGYSVGGTLTAIFSTLYGQYVRNLVQIAAPINFHDEGLLSQWTRKDRFNVDLIVDTLGNMPTELMRASFRMLKPTVQIAQQITLANKLGDTEAVQDFLAMQTWLNDHVVFPGEAYRKLIKECYQDNLLVQGRLVIQGKRVDLGQIEAPLLNIMAARDHLCPPQSSAVLNELVRSADKQLLELPSGHVGIVAGRTASKQLWPQLANWLIGRSQAPTAVQTTVAPASATGPSIEPTVDLDVTASEAPAAPRPKKPRRRKSTPSESPAPESGTT